MSDFQKQLNDEIEKRNHDDDTPDKSQKKKKVKKEFLPMFSFKSFSFVLLLCFSLTALLITWAWWKTPNSHDELKEKLPKKIAIVEAIDTHNEKTETKLTIERISSSNNKKQEKKNNDTLSPTKDNSFVPTSTDITSVEEEGKPYKVNQKSFHAQTNKPLLSFVITDLGLSSKKTKKIIENFPEEITLSFSPYGGDMESLSDTAKKDGHEIWLTLPLETQEYPINDPGPSTLLVNASTEKNTARLDNVLNSTKGYVGFITPHNHVFKAEDANVNPVIKNIFEKGYAIIDGNMSLRSFLSVITEKKDYPYAQNNLWLDKDLSPLTLNTNIRRLSEYADLNKNTIVMLHPYPASLKAVQKFLNSKASDKFELAPVSAQLINN